MVFDATCKVYRNTKVLGTHNRPTYTPGLIGTYECKVSRQNTSNAIQKQPQQTSETIYILFGPNAMDIKKGDLVDVGKIVNDSFVSDGVKYNTELVYRPGNHHTEATISITEEV